MVGQAGEATVRNVLYSITDSDWAVLSQEDRDYLANRIFYSYFSTLTTLPGGDGGSIQPNVSGVRSVQLRNNVLSRFNPVAGQVTKHLDGSFSVIDWSAYPAGVPRPPAGTTYRLLTGADYTAARRLADNANALLRRQGLVPAGYQVHEIVPVKFGGSPTDPANKVYLPITTHQTQVSPWWYRVQRAVE
jgi:hypothetical protein